MEREIVGRRVELATIAALVENINVGSFHALVLEGEPGIGKTTLWHAGVERARARGAIVAAARPAASESRLPYSALGDLIRDLSPKRLGELPEPLGGAVRAAVLLGPGSAMPEGAFVARGVADLLTAVARSEPLLVAIDDVQWLDVPSRSALAYALRRLTSSRARILLARRPPQGASTEIEDSLPQPDVDVVSIGPLSLSGLHEILLERTGQSLPRPLLVRVSRASGGNPYYALEIAREIVRSDEDRSGTIHLPRDVRRLTANRILRLPDATRAELLRLALTTRGRLPAGVALQPALDEGVVELETDGTVRFGHPLLAAATIDVASAAERRAIHLALAELEDDAVEKARHAALAAGATDAGAADAAAAGYELADSLGNAAAALELAELALRLTPHDHVDVRLERAVSYAEGLDAAGATPDGRAVLEREIAAAREAPGVRTAFVRLGWICWREGDFAAGIAACHAALPAEDDPVLRAEAYETLTWLHEGDLDRARDSAEQVVAARSEQGDEVLVSRARLLAAYFAIVSGRAPDRATIEADIEVLRHAGTLDQNPVPEMWAKFEDRLEDARAILERRLAFARSLHDEQFVVACLFAVGEVDTWLGRLEPARAAFAEALQLSDDLAGTTYLSSVHACAAQLAAIDGRIDEAQWHADEAVHSAAKGLTAALAHAAAGTAALAAGDLNAAHGSFVDATTLLDGIHMREPARFRHDGDHVETLVALGELERAEALVERLSDRLAVFGRPWLAVQVHRGRALVAGASGRLDEALAAAERACAACEELPMPFERARCDLVLGRLLRRAKRRGAARERLETALRTFEALPAPRWADSARDELARLGLGRSGDELTKTEQAVAAAAASGLKNREIAERLFMSPKTVEAHLSRTYRKLGVHSRAELVAKLAAMDTKKG